MRLTSPDVMKFSNYAHILRIVGIHPGICRRDVAKETGLSPQTLTNLVKELKEYGLVSERRLESKGKGRTPLGLTINRKEFVIITVTLGTGWLRVYLNSAAGDIYSKMVYHIQAGDPILAAIKSSVGEMLSFARGAFLNVLAIVMSAEGIVDEHDGVIRYGKAYGWNKVDLRRELSSFFLPFLLVDDVNIICDYLNARGDGTASNYLVVKLDSGVGCAITYNGKTLVSNGSTLGKFGHLKVHNPDENVRCWCGNENCLTAFVSRDALERKYRIPFEDVVENMKQNAGPGGDFTPTYVRYLSPILANSVSLLGIEKVYLTGLVPETLGFSFSHTVEDQVRPVVPPWVGFQGIEVLPKIPDVTLVSEYFLNFFFSHMVEFLALCRTSPFVVPNHAVE